MTRLTVVVTALLMFASIAFAQPVACVNGGCNYCVAFTSECGAGCIPTGWVFEMGGWTFNQTCFLTQTMSDAQVGTSISYLGERNFTDFSAEVTILHDLDLPEIYLATDGNYLTVRRLLSGGGIVFRYADYNNFYFYRFSGMDNLVLGKVINGNVYIIRTVEPYPRFQMKYGRPHVLRVEASGDYIQCYINGNPVIAEYDASLRVGKVGLITHKVRANFDNLTIWGPCLPQGICCDTPPMMAPNNPPVAAPAAVEWQAIGRAKPCSDSKTTKFYY
jgi:hypothetical protein